MKKLFTMILALVMILSLATTAFAATPVSLDISHIAADHTYVAYQIIKGDLDASGILTNPEWGPGVDGAGLLAALKADTTPITNSGGDITVTFQEVFAGVSDPYGVLDVLQDFTTNGDRLEHFAKIAADYIVPAEGTPSGAGSLQADGTYKYTIDNLDPGYYIIIDETDDANVGSEDYKTRYIVSLTTHTSLVTKGSYTTVEKNVGDAVGSAMSEHIANQLYKPHVSQIDADIDDDIGEFDAYYLEFNDSMSKGYDFLELLEVYVLEADSSKEYLYENGAWNIDASTYNWSVTGDDATGTEIVLEFPDLKKAFPAIAGDDHVIITYSAQLTENAVIGSANPNEVDIIFSNGPDTDDRGQSVPDYAYVFPFGVRLHKVDADNVELALPGAKFTLYHLHGTEKYYAGNVDANGKILGWTPYADQAAYDAALAAAATPEEKAAIEALGYAHEFETDANGNFVADGLDEGVNYYLHETVAPATYNLMFTDIAFSIHPTYAIGSGGVPYVESITYHVDGSDSIVSSGEDFEAGRVVVTALNDKGNTLPSTGGIGTTIFYILGSVLVVGAAVILVTKKRMNAEA